MSPRQSDRNSRADPRFFVPRVNLFGALGNVTTHARSKNLVLALQQTYLTRSMWSPWPTARNCDKLLTGREREEGHEKEWKKEEEKEWELGQ